MRAVLLVALAACQVGTTSRDEFQRDYPYGSTLGLSPTMLASAVGALERRVGSKLQITSLIAHDEYISFVVQDPKQPTHLDAYDWQAGALRTPSPVQVNDPTQLTLFPLAEVPLDLLPYAIKAHDQAKIEDGHVESVSIQRDVLTISIIGPRNSTTVPFTLSR